MNQKAAIAPPPQGPAILVTGGTGFIGSALVRQLRDAGRSVIVYSRNTEKARKALGPDVWVTDSLQNIPASTQIDAIVHLAGATVLGMPWTQARRELLVRSRAGVMQDLLAWMARLQQPPRVLVAASAVGYYGVPSGQQVVDELAPPQPGRFQSDLCIAIEQEAQRAQALQVRVVRMRFGIVLGHGGGAYPGIATASRLGVGSVLGSGTQPVPWILLDDAAGLVRFAIDNDGMQGAVNAVAPEITTQSAFAREMAASWSRSVRLRVPAWTLKLAMGEMSELLLEGQRVVPSVAVAAGYAFTAPSLRECLTRLTRRTA